MASWTLGHFVDAITRFRMPAGRGTSILRVSAIEPKCEIRTTCLHRHPDRKSKLSEAIQRALEFFDDVVRRCSSSALEELTRHPKFEPSEFLATRDLLRSLRPKLSIEPTIQSAFE